MFLVFARFVAVMAALLLLAAQPSRDLVVPDLSQAEPAVRRQLEQLIEDARQAGQDERPARLATLGAALLAHEYLDAAVSTLQKALELRPDWSDGNHYLGYALTRLGRYEQARAPFEHLLELEPDRLATQYHLARVEWELGDLDRAITRLSGALFLGPGSAAIHETLGQVQFDLGDLDQAIVHLERALELEPAANRIHYTLARAYRAAGNEELAMSHLERRGQVGVVIDDPALERLETLRFGATGRQLRGRQAYAAGRYEDAVAEFESALRADPTRNDIRLNLAAALGQAGQVERAIEQFELALAADPDRPRALSNLATLLLGQGKVERAVMTFRRALALDPGDTVARTQFARALAASGATHEAAENLRLVLDVEPSREELWLYEMDLLLSLRRFTEVRDRLELAHETLPTSGLLAEALARFLATTPQLELRDGERAVALAETVLRAAPDFDHRQTLVFALAEAGRCDDAAQSQQENVALLSERELEQRGSGDDALLERQRALLRHLVEQRPCRLQFDN